MLLEEDLETYFSIRLATVAGPGPGNSCSYPPPSAHSRVWNRELSQGTESSGAVRVLWKNGTEGEEDRGT